MKVAWASLHASCSTTMSEFGTLVIAVQIQHESLRQGKKCRLKMTFITSFPLSYIVGIHSCSLTAAVVAVVVDLHCAPKSVLLCYTFTNILTYQSEKSLSFIYISDCSSHFILRILPFITLCSQHCTIISALYFARMLTYLFTHCIMVF